MRLYGFRISPITLCWLRYLFFKPRILRYYMLWRNSLRVKTSEPNNQLPWMVFEAIDWLEAFLSADMQVFEWGSGGSTIFFSKRVQSVVSIEHDTEWYYAVKRQLRLSNTRNVHLMLCTPKESESREGAYTSTDPAYKGLSFRRYVEAIEIYPDGFFDLVVVDGRARASCLSHALVKIRPGGYLLLDNSDRSEYQRAKEVLSEWGEQEFYGPGPYNYSCWQTTVWRKDIDTQN